MNGDDPSVPGGSTGGDAVAAATSSAGTIRNWSLCGACASSDSTSARSASAWWNNCSTRCHRVASMGVAV